jgi:hypothetical protein
MSCKKFKDRVETDDAQIIVVKSLKVHLHKANYFRFLCKLQYQ